MKPAVVLPVVLAAFLAACSPKSEPNASRSAESRLTDDDLLEARRAAGSLASLVADLQSGARQQTKVVGSPAGDLWIEVGRLRREGQNVRHLEWQISELEESMRHREDATARRRRLDTLLYEVEALNRRLR